MHRTDFTGPNIIQIRRTLTFQSQYEHTGTPEHLFQILARRLESFFFFLVIDAILLLLLLLCFTYGYKKSFITVIGSFLYILEYPLEGRGRESHTKLNFF